MEFSRFCTVLLKCVLYISVTPFCTRVRTAGSSSWALLLGDTERMYLCCADEFADGIVKDCRHWESKTMNNEVEIEELDKNTREARRIGSDNEMKYDNLARSLAMMEDELKRADERVKNAEARVEVIEAELTSIGENQKQLEISEEKGQEARGEVPG